VADYTELFWNLDITFYLEGRQRSAFIRKPYM